MNQLMVPKKKERHTLRNNSRQNISTSNIANEIHYKYDRRDAIYLGEMYTITMNISCLHVDLDIDRMFLQM